MSFTYDEAKLHEALYALRLKLGDTDADRQLLQDEEINSVINTYTVTFRRIAECCELICAKYAGTNDYKFGSDSEKLSQIYKNYKEMAQKYNSLSAGEPWAGGIYISDKDSIEDNDSLVKPKFKVGMHDNSN